MLGRWQADDEVPDSTMLLLVKITIVSYLFVAEFEREIGLCAASEISRTSNVGVAAHWSRQQAPIQRRYARSVQVEDD